MKVLLTGASGQLAKAFIRYFIKNNIDFYAPPENVLDITNRSKVKNEFSSYKPTHVINCAAYNFVDGAEESPEIAFLINRDAVEILAEESNKAGVYFVHYSTGYVFDGKKNDFYVEEDKTFPLSKYAQSKYEGELKAALADKYLIFRLNWVIGEGTQNFLYKLKTWAQFSSVLKIASDEVAVPTFTFDIVDASMQAIKKELTGLHHFANSGNSSRYALAKHYAKIKGINNSIIPVTSESFNLKAKRPLFSSLSNCLISSKLGMQIPDWEESMKKYCEEYDK